MVQKLKKAYKASFLDRFSPSITQIGFGMRLGIQSCYVVTSTSALDIEMQELQKPLYIEQRHMADMR